jgi:hypothetical protein
MPIHSIHGQSWSTIVDLKFIHLYIFHGNIEMISFLITILLFLYVILKNLVKVMHFYRFHGSIQMIHFLIIVLHFYVDWNHPIVNWVPYYMLF